MSPEEMAARISKRVARMTTDDLMSWADTATYGMQRQLDDFRRNPDEQHLAEIKLAALSMDAVADELGVRLAQSKRTS
jgi:hypothetical protein